MSLKFLKAGMQTTLQAGERRGNRHFGVPAAGPADRLSMSLANRLVGNPESAVALEFTLTGGKLVFSEDIGFALTGADVKARLNNVPVHMHETYLAEAGDILDIGPALNGCRTYLALAGDVVADEFLSSKSTYLPAKFGGLDGRALQDGDEIQIRHHRLPDEVETPQALRPLFNDLFLLQVCPGPDFDMLGADQDIFQQEFTVGQRSSRMGVQLEDGVLELSNAERLQSAAVFQGTVQLPPDGQPFVLLADSQATGGYPHVLQVSRSDRFQLGQLRPGAKVKFICRTPEEARERFRARAEGYKDWLAELLI